MLLRLHNWEGVPKAPKGTREGHSAGDQGELRGLRRRQVLRGRSQQTHEEASWRSIFLLRHLHFPHGSIEKGNISPDVWMAAEKRQPSIETIFRTTPVGSRGAGRISEPCSKRNLWTSIVLDFIFVRARIPGNPPVDRKSCDILRGPLNSVECLGYSTSFL